jgi:exosortase E/protease (VPEID-CTERM system)
MTGRVAILLVLLGAEVLAGSIAFDGEHLATGAVGLLGVLGNWGAWVLRWAVAATLLFSGFAYLQGRTVPAALFGRVIRPAWLTAHLVALAAFASLSISIYIRGDGSDLAVIAWAGLAMIVAATAAFAVLPPAAWVALRRETGSLWLTASAAAALACWLGALSRHLWQPVTYATFALVKSLLSLVMTNFLSQPDRLRLGTANFTVIISPECSGLEGMGLFLIFGLLWLILFRDELRFPNAILLLPVGIAALYLLNVLRIFALVLIGNAGWKQIALRGFHSQAGWIAFCLVALALLMASRKLAWISASGPIPAESAVEYPAAAYLVPFIAIMSAGILSQAMTAHFEWPYALRLLAAVIAFWAFRRQYREIDWRFGWLAVAAGVFVFLVWIAVGRLIHGASLEAGMPLELAQSSAGVRFAWLSTRIAGTVLAVPVAEELAFRGFGMRRFIAPNFDTVPWRSWNWMALGCSSILFGALHGGLWPAGVVAGLIYGGLMIRYGRLGDAVAAHATTNALLALYVLAAGRWDLW